MALEDPSVLVSGHKREPFDGELASRFEVHEARKTLAGLTSIGKANGDDRLTAGGISVREGRLGFPSGGFEAILGLLKMRLSSCGVLSEGRLLIGPTQQPAVERWLDLITGYDAAVRLGENAGSRRQPGGRLPP